MKKQKANRTMSPVVFRGHVEQEKLKIITIKMFGLYEAESRCDPMSHTTVPAYGKRCLAARYRLVEAMPYFRIVKFFFN